MKVRSKLILLIALCAAVACVFTAAVAAAGSAWLGSIFAVELRSLEERSERIVKLVGQPIENFVNDNTYWDDMAAFVQSADPAWARENIEDPLTPYEADRAWVYDAEGRLVYTARPGAGVPALPELSLPQGAVQKLFERSRFCHFYARTPAGLVEVSGATIHPSADIKRKTPPQGYFFVGKIWDREHLDTLGSLCSAEVSTAEADFGRAPESDPRRGAMVLRRALKDWTGAVIAVMTVVGVSEPVRIFHAVSRIALEAFVAFAASLLAILAVFLTRLVISPLVLILRSLDGGDPAILKSLARRRDELGRVADLIRKSAEEHKLLVGEVAARKKIESDLSLSNERFTKVFRSNPSMMALSKLESGELIDVNNAFVQTFGYARQELIGRTSIELGIFTPEARSLIVRKIRQDGAIRNEEVEMQGKTGEKRLALFSGEVMEVAGEEILVSVSVDITPRKRAEDALRQKVEELERFNKLAVGREARMIELKEKIRELEERVR